MQLNSKELGQGTPIIILHGLFGMLDNWMAVGKKLAEHYSVYLESFTIEFSNFSEDELSFNG